MLSSVKGIEGHGFFFFFFLNSVLWASGLRGLGFLPVLEPFVYTACVLRGALRFLIYYYSLKKKEKKVIL
jgi:hypothetical protein